MRPLRTAGRALVNRFEDLVADRRKRSALLALIILLGGLLRLRVAMQGDPVNPSNPWERQEYAMQAEGLMRQGVYKESINAGPTAYRGILYPGFIAAVERWSPVPPFRLTLLAQAFLGTLTIVLIYGCGVSVLSPAVGLGSAFLFAFNPMYIDFAGSTEIETVFAFLIVCVLALLLEWAENPTPKNSFLLGCAIGTTILCRSLLRFLPFYLCGLCLLRRDWRLRLPSTLLWMVLGMALSTAPWALRNQVRFGELSPFERGLGGMTLEMAALGMVHTVHDDAIKSSILAEFPPEEYTTNRMPLKDSIGKMAHRMALRQLAEDPKPYLRAFTFRVLLYGPFLLLWPWFVARRTPHRGVYMVAILHSYFGIHLFAATHFRYLLPTFPSAGLLLLCLLVSRTRTAAARPEAARVWAYRATVALACFYAVGLFWTVSDVAAALAL